MTADTRQAGPHAAAVRPRGLIIRAAALTALYGIAHLAGLRQNTSILCGMSPTAGAPASASMFLGAVYVVLYLIVTIVVPVLLIAAALLWLWDRRHANA
jgi:hypothetical protein